MFNHYHHYWVHVQSLSPLLPVCSIIITIIACMFNHYHHYCPHVQSLSPLLPACSIFITIIVYMFNLYHHYCLHVQSLSPLSDIFISHYCHKQLQRSDCHHPSPSSPILPLLALTIMVIFSRCGFDPSCVWVLQDVDESDGVFAEAAGPGTANAPGEAAPPTGNLAVSLSSIVLQAEDKGRCLIKPSHHAVRIMPT